MTQRYLLDTNAVIALLQGASVNKLLKDAEWIGISVITTLEFLAFPKLTVHDKKLFNKFLERVEVIDLTSKDTSYLDLCISLRKKYSLKLPDAIIAASAISYDCCLVTNDHHFSGVGELVVKGW